MLTNVTQRDFRIVDVLPTIGVPFDFPLPIPRLHVAWFEPMNLQQFDATIHSKDPRNFPVLRDDRRIHVVMRGKALRQSDVDGLEFIFLAIVINRVIALAANDSPQSRDQQDLKYLPPLS